MQEVKENKGKCFSLFLMKIKFRSNSIWFPLFFVFLHAEKTSVLA